MRFSPVQIDFRRARHGLTHVCVCVAVALAWSAPAEVVRPAPARAARRATDAETDAALRRAALAALGSREGTIIVMDARTGRVRAVAGRRFAEGGAFPPGSAVKPFTLLAALRASLVGADTRLLCRKHYRAGATEFSCSHPVFKPRFGPADALAHSCNYFFARLSERMRADDFATTLASYGLGQTTAASRASDAAREAGEKRSADAPRRANAPRPTNAPRQTHHAEPVELAPRVSVGEWGAETALGEGGGVLVTPFQLIAAYAALANGGRLYEPREAAAENFEPRELGRVPLAPQERALLLAGMRGAVRYGTAERARLDALPLRVFGKTGTATEVGGFRTHGWFVGLASDAPAKELRAAEDEGQADPSSSTTGEELEEVGAESAARDQPAPEEVSLAVLVFLKRAQGKECAELARPVFEEYARLASIGAGAGGGTRAASPIGATPDNLDRTQDADAARGAGGAPDAGGAGDERIVRVRLARDGAVRAMPLGEYLFGVLAAEASTENEFAALEAQAVVSRTYALSKLSRHARDNFDFCTTTHCQRYLRVSAADSRPEFHALLRRAIAETAGEVLRDPRGRAADAYFSANCGGMTADVAALWGTPARLPFERGVRDEFCPAAPDSHWRDRVPARRLAEALRADSRSDVGPTLDSVSVTRRDATGRAELVELRGETRRLLRGWDFKIIVGRSLGWATIKSSRFSVERAGADFVFRGTGFGHGLGLCQAGAHAMARGGAPYRQILAHYFPGATIGQLSAPPRSKRDEETSRGIRSKGNDAETGDENRTTGIKESKSEGESSEAVWRADASAPLTNSQARMAVGQRRAPAAVRPAPAGRLTLSSEHFRVSFPAGRDTGARRDAESVLATLEAAGGDMRRRLEAASLAPPAPLALEVNVSETTAEFVAATGQPSWVAAATRGRRVELQPLATLRRRGVLTETLRHEYAHAVLDALSRGRVQHWLAEGLAAYFAGEGPLLSPHAPRERINLDELERRLCEPNSAAETRALYAAAYREVLALVRAEGEPAAWRRAAGR